MNRRNRASKSNMFAGPYFKGHYQYFEDDKGSLWRRKFDRDEFEHGEWKRVEG